MATTIYLHKLKLEYMFGEQNIFSCLEANFIPSISARIIFPDWPDKEFIVTRIEFNYIKHSIFVYLV